DPGCRACMIWDKEKQNRDLFNYVKAFVRLRQSDDIFANNARFKFVEADNEANSLIFEKYNDKKRVIFIVNNGKQEMKTELNVHGVVFEYERSVDCFLKRQLTDDSISTIKVEPYHFRIFEV